MEERKLTFELVPDGCWRVNLRSILKPAAWDYIRKDAYARAGGKCMVCGEKCNRLEAHERWEYDEARGIQKLTDVVAVCKRCHTAIHIGRAQLVGKGEQAEDWYMKVNGCTYAEMRADLGKANEEQRRRNLVPEWKLDLSFLKKYSES